MIKARPRFTYQRRAPETVRARATMKNSQYDSIFKQDIKTYTVRDGKNLIRVLPPTWPNAVHYGYDVYVNYNVGADRQKYLSLSKMLGKPDPLAEAKRAAEAEGDKVTAKALVPSRRIGCWLVDREAEDEGPQLWLSPFGLDQNFAKLATDEDTGAVLYLDDPETGCDIRFYKEGKELATRYDPLKIKIMQPSPIHEDEKLQAEWLEYVNNHPVPDCLNYYDYKYIAGVFNGEGPSEESEAEDEAEVEAPPPRRATRVQQPEPQADPEVDEEAPWEEPDNDAEQAASGIRARLAARKTQAEPEGDNTPQPRRAVRR